MPVQVSRTFALVIHEYMVAYAAVYSRHTHAALRSEESMQQDLDKMLRSQTQVRSVSCSDVVARV